MTIKELIEKVEEEKAAVLRKYWLDGGNDPRDIEEKYDFALNILKRL